jgi:hypothetical protein
LPSDTSCVSILSSDLVATGSKSGQVSVFDRNGKEQWTATAEPAAAIVSLSETDGASLALCDGVTLVSLGKKRGERLGSYRDGSTLRVSSSPAASKVLVISGESRVFRLAAPSLALVDEFSVEADLAGNGTVEAQTVYYGTKKGLVYAFPLSD